MTQPRAQPKLFSLTEANQTLPLVKRIVEDIVRLHGEVLEARSRVEELAEQGKTSAAEEAHVQMEDLLDQLGEFVCELEGLGCQLKDSGQGLVDFPTRRDDRVVLWCWRRGEPEIRFWHETDAGFAGRQPVQTAP